jgi:hypothetical protein
MEDVGIFYGHLVHFTVFCYVLWTFVIVCGNLVYFFPFWYFVPRKIWQPWVRFVKVVLPGSTSCLRRKRWRRLRRCEQTWNTSDKTFLQMDVRKGFVYKQSKLNWIPGGTQCWKLNATQFVRFEPGVDVMITIFCDFSQFSAKKLAFFSETNVMINFFQNLVLFWFQNANFFAKFFGENI